MKWKYVEPLKDANAVQKFLAKEKIQMPDELISFIAQHNGGRPEINRFDTNKRKECVFDGVFSYNEEDPENIYGIYVGELRETLKQQGVFPIGMNPSGDLICVELNNKGRIILVRMESGEHELIGENINEVLNKLY